jgi:hypothetical protein
MNGCTNEQSLNGKVCKSSSCHEALYIASQGDRVNVKDEQQTAFSTENTPTTSAANPVVPWCTSV